MSIYGIWFGSVHVTDMDNPINLLNYVWMVNHGNPGYYIFMWGLTLVLLLPLIWLTIKGLGRLFQFKYPKHLTTSIGVAWIILFLAFVGFIGSKAVEYSTPKQFANREEIKTNKKYTIDMMDADHTFNHESILGQENYQVPWHNTFKIKGTKDSTFHLLINRKTWGRNSNTAFYNITKKDQSLYDLNDSMIQLKNHIDISKRDKFKFQIVNFTLQIPEGKEIYINKGMNPMMGKYGYGKYAGHTVKNVNGTIKCLDCIH